MGIFDYFKLPFRRQNIKADAQRENINQIEKESQPIYVENLPKEHIENKIELKDSFPKSDIPIDSFTASKVKLINKAEHPIDTKEKYIEAKGEVVILDNLDANQSIRSATNVSMNKEVAKTNNNNTAVKRKKRKTIDHNIDLLENEEDTKYKEDELNEEQKAAVSFEGKHLLVLAGAGTGKTKTIISRALHLVNKGVSPSKILILSFTRKSAYEIVSRIKSLNAKSIGITGQTFHSWCMGIIKSNPNIFECSNSTCLDEEDRENAIKLLCGKKFKDKDDKRISPALIVNVYSYSLNAKCSLSESIRVKAYDNGSINSLKDQIEKNKPIYEDIIKKYITYKQEHNYIDYDDILKIVAVGLKKNPNIAQFIASRYEHILVDEMQDTNPLQYELLSSFYDYCHLFCVGDDAQSIYGFRGADFKTMHSFTKTVPDSQSLKLSLNYRSTQEILDISNWVLSESPLKYDKELKSFKGHGDKPKMIHVNNDWDEANHITDDILISINERGYEYKDHLVLSRSNSGLKKIEACCLSKKIPYKIFGGTQLMQSKHVRDVMSALRIAANFHDELAWVRYLHLWAGIGDATTAKIIQQLYGCQTLNNCVSRLKGLNLQLEIHKTLESIDGLQSNPSRAIKVALDIMSPRLKELYKDNGWSSRKKDFKLLKEIAKNSGSIGEFIAEYILDPKLGTYNKDGGKEEDFVTLSTIHSAKGLEAANCYIVNVSPYSYPTPRAILNGIDAIEEERRCLYVALTRAKDKLYLYRNILATSIEESRISFDSYDESIEKGMYFIQRKFGTKIKIINIKEEKNESIVYFVIQNDEDNIHTMSEWAFRKSYVTEEEYNSTNAGLLYFLNNIPSGIINIEYLNPENQIVDKEYNGPKISTNFDDFDFN